MGGPWGWRWGRGQPETGGLQGGGLSQADGHWEVPKLVLGALLPSAHLVILRALGVSTGKKCTT